MLHDECRIRELGGLLQHREQVLAVVEAEADEIAAKFGSPRCTVMSAEPSSSMSVEDIIPNSQSLVVFSRKGYIKRIPADTFAVQHRGGRGDAPFAPSPPSALPHPALQWPRSFPLQHTFQHALTCLACFCDQSLTICVLQWTALLDNGHQVCWHPYCFAYIQQRTCCDHNMP